MGNSHCSSEQLLVKTQFDMIIDQVRLPAGSVGIVLYVHRSGLAYEVEFQQPFHCMLTLERRMIDEVLKQSGIRLADEVMEADGSSLHLKRKA